MSDTTEHRWSLKTDSSERIVYAFIIDEGRAIQYYTVHESEYETVYPRKRNMTKWCARIPSRDPEQRLIRGEIIDDGKALECYSISKSEYEKLLPQVTSPEIIIKGEFEEIFPIVEVEKISLDDEFMIHRPVSKNQERVKRNIIEAKRIGMKNFRKPAIDPSFSDDGKNIIYEAGRKPAVGKNGTWWDELFEKFMPNKNSRLGTVIEYDAFLGTIIKFLVEEQEYGVYDAWNIVCDNSRELGYFMDFKDWDDFDNSSHELERTGSRPVGKWFDLGNVEKIIRNVGCGGPWFWIASASYWPKHKFSLAYLMSSFTLEATAVGWLVLDV